jgi:hypothetical protein
MIDKPSLLEASDQIASKILNANISVSLFHCGDVHAMNRHDTPWHKNSIQLVHYEIKVSKELFVIP